MSLALIQHSVGSNPSIGQTVFGLTSAEAQKLGPVAYAQKNNNDPGQTLRTAYFQAALQAFLIDAFLFQLEVAEQDK